MLINPKFCILLLLIIDPKHNLKTLIIVDIVFVVFLAIPNICRKLKIKEDIITHILAIIYQALMEDRPYRKPMSHQEASKILENLIIDGSLDEKITRDVIRVFAS